MNSLIELEKKINSELTTKINSSEIRHNQLYIEIDKEDYANVLNFCSASNIEYVTEVFEWINWRSIFIKDPESNVV